MNGGSRVYDFARVATNFLEQIGLSTRQRIAGGLDARREELIRAWEQRHRSEPLLAESVIAQLGDWEVYRRAYLEPLMRTLARGVRHGRTDHLDVYAYERTRFVSLHDVRNGGRESLARTFAGDVEDVAAIFEAQPTDAEVVRSLLQRLHDPIIDEDDSRAVRVVMVGDCLLTDVSSFLGSRAREHGVHVHCELLYFSAWAGRELSREELLATLEHERWDLIGLSFLTYEGIPPYVALLSEADRLSRQERERRVDQIDAVAREYVRAVRAATNIPIVLHGCCGLPLTHLREFVPALPALSRGRQHVAELLNNRMRELAENTENMIFLDEQAAIAPVGSRVAGRRLLPRRLTHGGLFHPTMVGPLLAEAYEEIVRAYETLRRCKVLLVDFDNTLWQGVMAEGPVVHDVGAQQLLKQLKDAGILLVSVSKNDAESIRWEEMTLERSDFVLQKVGWNLKSQSIEEASHQLDLGVDSFVLIDDNPVERELVTSALPAVRALDPTDQWTWRALAMLLEFPGTRLTVEAARRTEMYREAAARRDAISGGADYAAMMGSLDLRVRFGAVREEHLDRVSELVARTNQFNTTTIRRDRAELAAIMKDPDAALLAGTLSDKFGDLGIVGVSILHREGSEIVFDGVIMSCRAMGFGFETVLVRCAIDAMTESTSALGLYVASERNRPCAGLFVELGFTEFGDGRFRIMLDGDAPAPAVPDWLTVSPL